VGWRHSAALHRCRHQSTGRLLYPLRLNPTQPCAHQAGSLAWAFASLAEGPIDFYKSQMQKQLVMSKVDPSYKPEFKSMAQCVSRSVQLNGVRFAAPSPSHPPPQQAIHGSSSTRTTVRVEPWTRNFGLTL
jgi:hypothetical protein